MRVVIAEDSALLRDGLVQLLQLRDVEVAAAVGDAEALLTAVAAHEPDVAVVDIRLPPTQTDEGVRAAVQLRDRHPATGVLLFSQYVETTHAAQLLGNPVGFGYLLKERVVDIGEFVGALERVAAGGTALDPRWWPNSSALPADPPPSTPSRPASARSSPSWRRAARTTPSPPRSPSPNEPWKTRGQHLHQARPAPDGNRKPPSARSTPLLGDNPLTTRRPELPVPKGARGTARPATTDRRRSTAFPSPTPTQVREDDNVPLVPGSPRIPAPHR